MRVLVPMVTDSDWILSLSDVHVVPDSRLQAKAFVALLPPKPDTDCADVGAGAAGGGAVAVLAAQLVTSPEFRSVTKLVRILSRGTLTTKKKERGGK